ncbi:Peptidyl-prolyl cis-trans isomerase B [Smittium mucronatum]|uniref:peptidylprolyl isomerase n=1 Tax=Smittium mucronatum TaxID=133383 RepID=A0A1R0GVC3_9FUNG|nr:Peptidyl-prolyl cis-trans isomerase B [Smittium mucronatum]
MANKGPNSNGTQFLIITTEDCSHLDNKNVAFGRVIGGFDVVDKLNHVDLTASKTSGKVSYKPAIECKISHCGELIPVKKSNKKIRDISHSPKLAATNAGDIGIQSSSSDSDSRTYSSSSDSRDQRSVVTNRRKSRKRQSSRSPSTSSQSSVFSDSDGVANSRVASKRKPTRKAPENRESLPDSKPRTTPRSRWEDDRLERSKAYKRYGDKRTYSYRHHRSESDGEFKRDRSTNRRNTESQTNKLSENRINYKGRGFMVRTLIN